ncbi:MAG: hypothetical protein EOP09_17480 [Proteobacteria bacterium]|nr:MAG: hypothetical protein EOP09_17480 [Pseudomonadota bacterium]
MVPLPTERKDLLKVLSFRLKSPLLYFSYAADSGTLNLENETGFSTDDRLLASQKLKVSFDLDLRVYSDSFAVVSQVFEEQKPLSRFLINRYGVAFFEVIPWVRPDDHASVMVGNRFRGIFVVLHPSVESLSLKEQVSAQLMDTWTDEDSQTRSRTETSAFTLPGRLI